MGYLHILNLYRDYRIMAFREVYAMEKIHGTSAHVGWNKGELRLFSGGANHESFRAIFNHEDLKLVFGGIGHEKVLVYGEAYGGKMQGMSKTYGPALKFVAFDVMVGDTWLNVLGAEHITLLLGLEFVAYNLVPATPDALDAERDLPSRQAKRNGIVEDRQAEGIVIRPPYEVTAMDGSRIIAKHKREEFSERCGPSPDVRDATKREQMANADAIALEWVTDMRLSHVLDKLGSNAGIERTGEVIAAMVEDVCREAGDEILDSKPARRAIGSAAAKLFKRRLQAALYGGER